MTMTPPYVDRKQALRLKAAKKNEATVKRELKRLVMAANLEHRLDILSCKDYPQVGNRLSLFHLWALIARGAVIPHNEVTRLSAKPMKLDLRNVSRDMLYVDHTTGLLYFWNGKEWTSQKRKSGIRFERVGLSPDTVVHDRVTGKFFMVESKNQGAAGNAHERVSKYFAVTKTLRYVSRIKKVQPFAFVFSGAMATHVGYILEQKNYDWVHPNQVVFLDRPQDNGGKMKEMFERVILPALGLNIETTNDNITRRKVHRK